MRARRIKIEMDHPYYFSGSIVSGKVILDVSSAIQCEGLKHLFFSLLIDVLTANSMIAILLEFSGTEEIHWREVQKSASIIGHAHREVQQRLGYTHLSDKVVKLLPSFVSENPRNPSQNSLHYCFTDYSR